MTKISDKSVDNQSEARISVAYNKNCHSSLMTSFVKHPPVFACSVNAAIDIEYYPEGTIHSKWIKMTKQIDTFHFFLPNLELNYIYSSIIDLFFNI